MMLLSGSLNETKRKRNGVCSSHELQKASYVCFAAYKPICLHACFVADNVYSVHTYTFNLLVKNKSYLLTHHFYMFISVLYCREAICYDVLY